MVQPGEVDFIDVSPKQIVSVAAALIPFLEHDDANRALMGANMQRQAVPLLRPEVPLVGTGMERQVARQLAPGASSPRRTARCCQLVRQLHHHSLRQSGREERYPLSKFVRSNQGTCISQRPLVAQGRPRDGRASRWSTPRRHGER